MSLPLSPPLPSCASGGAVCHSDLPQGAVLLTAKGLGMMSRESSTLMELVVAALAVPLLALDAELHHTKEGEGSMWCTHEKA